MSQGKIILIAGPTASGKSALALDLARQRRGTIINADAMQVYQGLPLLSAQPDAAAQNEIPHKLYGGIDPGEAFSTGKWLDAAKRAITESLNSSRIPILTGGTGLYFKSLMGGLAPIPAIPVEVRQTATDLYAELGEEKFRQHLATIDPASAARLKKNDRQRLIRAYEVAAHTGQPLSYWHAAPASGFLDDFTIERHLVMPERGELYARCDRRLTLMIERGAVEETKAFLQRKLNPELPAMKTLGLREIAAYLNGDISLDEAITAAQQATRNYAKRQMTWFRNQWNDETVEG